MSHRSRIAGLAFIAGLSFPIAFAAGRASAQSIQVNAGSSPTIRVLPGGKLTVPVIVDLSSASPLNIAALTVALNWNPASLSFDSLRVAPGLGWTFTPNIAGAAGGTVSFTTSNSAALPVSSTIANLFFTAGSTQSGTRVTPAISAAGNLALESILPSMRPRRVDVCVAVSGKWGDATNDNTVNIVDAQQLARFSVGLTVADANAISKRGDVTNDGVVNIIDAQQIARFSVLLPSVPRTGNEAYVQPSPTDATITPSTQQRLTLAGTVQMTATPSHSTLGDLTGCESFIWGSSNPAVASVNSTGFVTALSLGSATITATSLSNPAIAVSTNIVVEDPATIRVAITHAGRPAKQYIAEVSGGGFTAIEGFVLSGANMNSGLMEIPVPSNGSYTIRMVAIDAASTTNPLVIAGGLHTIAVPAGGIVDLALPLTSPTYETMTVPSFVRLGSTMAVSWKVTDPAQLLDGPVRETVFCGTVHTNINVMTTDFSGTQSDACGVTINGPGILSYSNSTTPVSAQLFPGTLRAQLRATQFVRTGIGPATDIVVHWLHPSVARGDSPLSIPVPPLVQVQVIPESPTIPGGTTLQMSVTTLDAMGPILGLPVTWNAPSPTVVTVSPTGLVTGIGPGQVGILATVATKTGLSTVTVSGSVAIASLTIDPLSTLTGNATTTAVARARDANGNIIPNVAIAWTSSNFRIARISASGEIQALGSGTSQITATAGSVSTTALINVSATPQAFNVVLRPRTSMTPNMTSAFTAAAQRWSQIIRGDVPNAPLANVDVSVCLDQAPGTTVLNEVIDDVVIYSNVAAIDGAGGTLAIAGPCVLRDATGQTIVGVMTLDAADIAQMEVDATLASVVLHEMGHVLGIGTNWGPLLLNPSLSPATGDPTFGGTNAQWAFSKLGTGYAGAIVPVENCCGTGTRNTHWRESVLQRELMTGFVTIGGINPLSPLTAASLIDIGYTVDVNQSDFAPSFLRALSGPSERRMEIGEQILVPRFTVDAAGRTGPIRSVRAPLRAPLIRRD